MSSGENNQPQALGIHPRNLGEDDRKVAMSALARRRWGKRDRMRDAANDHASHDANIDASMIEGGAVQTGMAAPSIGSSATAAVDAAVVAELERKAAAGDIGAARELREWRRRDPADDADADSLRLASLIVQMSRVERAELRQWLLTKHETPAASVNREIKKPVPVPAGEQRPLSPKLTRVRSPDSGMQRRSSRGTS
jgi:hypothetical protein